MVAWNLTVSETRADGASSETASGESVVSTFLMKLDDVMPETGEAWDNKDATVLIDGTSENIRVAIEVLSGPPLGGFPDSAVSIEFSYGVYVSVAIERNGIYRQVASIALNFTAECRLLSTSGPELSSLVMDGYDYGDGEPEFGVLPPLTVENFEFNDGGNTYVLAIDSLDDSGYQDDRTFVSAAARLTGNGVELTTDVMRVEHIFSSFVAD